MIDSSISSLEDIFSKIGFGRFQILIIIILGLIQFYDAVEMVLLGFLGTILECFWHISLWESSFITIAVFAGMSVGSLIFGKLGDIYGRKPIIMISTCGIFYFSVMCSISPTLIWLIFIRFMIGFFIGGITSMIFTFLVEFVPMNHRGSAIMCVQLSWSLGSIYLTFLTFILVPIMGWRIWLVITVCPMIFIILFATWLPESPRYLLQINKKNEMIQVINKVATMNRAERISDFAVKKNKLGSISDLFHRNYALTTVILSYIWFVIGFNYYGFVLATPIINTIPHKCLQNMNTVSDHSLFANSSTDTSCCVNISWDNIKTVLISVIGEFMSYIVGVFLIRYVKRKLYIQILLLIIGIIYFLTNLCLSPTGMGILIMFGRGASTVLAGVTYIYTSEVFPTSVRGFAAGFNNNFNRIGSMFSSINVNIVMVGFSLMVATLIFSLLNIVAFLLVFALPYETITRPLQQTTDEEVISIDIMERNK